MRYLVTILLTAFYSTLLIAQTPQRKIPAKRTTAAIKIDGYLDDAAWKEAAIATGFIEMRPTPGKPEDATNKTVVYLLYDNTSVYVGGYCYERTKDSVSKELVGRDQVGSNDFVGIIIDTYNDKINASGFYVTPLGEQYDAKYSNSTTNGEDDTWNAVWHSEAKIHADGWSFEIRIPYSALRFSSAPKQNWGINIIRRRQKTGQQYSWSPVDPKKNGFVNQEGLWTDLENIQSPVRLSLSPYFSAYLNHYPQDGAKDWSHSINGGLDLKYGISPAFTLDMTLVPDFGQVQSDNQVLNLTPFEVKYNENRPFFTEGTELFSKGNLFYSRRVGGTPIHFGDVQDTTSSYAHIKSNEHFLKNPSESKLINATKISGRTKHGLGVGFFNAITQPMYAEVEDDAKNRRKIETAPLTNYNIVVLDQTLKNNSAISFINTNVLRSGNDYDANVSAALFDINNKKNTYNWNGKFAVSHLTNATGKNINGYSHMLNFSKFSGSWQFQLGQEAVDNKYNINDMGILFNNNYLDHYFWTSYRWLKPKNWHNRIQVNYNAYYSRLFKTIPDQKISSMFQIFQTNINANAQLKNLWFVGAYIGYLPQGNDFYEPHVAGRSFRTPERRQVNVWTQTNVAKKYYVQANVFYAMRSLFHSPNLELNFSHRYRFSDKFSLTQDLNYNPTKNDAGYYDLLYSNATGEASDLEDVLFSRRNRQTVENIIRAKYNFNNRSGITFRARHYWSKVEPKQLYDLQNDGTLLPTRHTNVAIQNTNYNIFNIDAVYTLQFAPGSFINIVWKSAIETLDQLSEQQRYFKNFDNTLQAPQNNNFSIKILYYLDYLDIKKWRAKKSSS